MKPIRLLLCLLATFAGHAIEGLADTWPRLTDTAPVQCSEALRIAKLAFDSDVFYLYAPPAIPADFPSVLVLEPKALDISGGGALEADDTVFDKPPIDGDGAPRSLYWQKTTEQGHRLAVVETAYGWRGDMYSVFDVDERTRPDAFLSDLRGEPASRKFTAVVADSWRPPLVFRELDSGRAWFIDVGQPYRFLADWRVHVVEPSGVKHRCTVRFRPNAPRAVDLLPKPVRELARLLDRTLGRGENEGTFQPTARLRLAVEHTWANAARRPWVSGTPYNTREEVDAGLEHWSRTGPAYREAYRAIRRQYPVAERALADYYRRRFGRSAAEAKASAAYLLDIAFRSYYVFPSEATDHRDYSRNPWKR